MSTVELNKAAPSIRNIRLVVATLKFLNNAHPRWLFLKPFPNDKRNQASDCNHDQGRN